jgi:hypothetical protein
MAIEGIGRVKIISFLSQIIFQTKGFLDVYISVRTTSLLNVQKLFEG